MKLGMKSVERETVGMNQLVADLIEQTVEGRADRDKFNFRVAGLADAEGDRALLRVILANLLANAVKYCATQPFPQIEVGWQARGPQAGAWFVRDNGVGFDAARAVKLFGMFQRFHDHAEFPGYGIGLAIVRRLVEKHGGQVWAESSPGKGATFFFTLQAEPGSDEYTPA
jgi:signal transduction histidine kinase